LDAKQKEFSQLVKNNQGLILKVSRLYTNSLEDEQDLFQEIVLQLWRSYDSFKGNPKLRLGCTEWRLTRQLRFLEKNKISANR
jgi:RNA polymerase sigma-70 factor (ECF subfamily)